MRREKREGHKGKEEEGKRIIESERDWVNWQLIFSRLAPRIVG